MWEAISLILVSQHFKFIFSWLSKYCLKFLCLSSDFICSAGSLFSFFFFLLVSRIEFFSLALSLVSRIIVAAVIVLVKLTAFTRRYVMICVYLCVRCDDASPRRHSVTVHMATLEPAESISRSLVSRRVPRRF